MVCSVRCQAGKNLPAKDEEDLSTLPQEIIMMRQAIRALETVSYTHLDVYKRQPQTGGELVKNPLVNIEMVTVCE